MYALIAFMPLLQFVTSYLCDSLINVSPCYSLHLACSPLYLQCLAQCLTHSECLIPMWCTTEDLLAYFVSQMSANIVVIISPVEDLETLGDYYSSTRAVHSLTRGLNSRTTRSWPELKPRIGCLTDWTTQAPQWSVVLNATERSRKIKTKKWPLDLVIWSLLVLLVKPVAFECLVKKPDFSVLWLRVMCAFELR